MTALLSSFELGDLLLPSRVVMAPLTRRRAGPGKLATPLMATHYGQRAGAALIISESTEVDPLSAGSEDADELRNLGVIPSPRLLHDSLGDKAVS